MFFGITYKKHQGDPSAQKCVAWGGKVDESASGYWEPLLADLKKGEDRDEQHKTGHGLHCWLRDRFDRLVGEDENPNPYPQFEVVRRCQWVDEAKEMVMATVCNISTPTKARHLGSPRRSVTVDRQNLIGSPVSIGARRQQNIFQISQCECWVIRGWVCHSVCMGNGTPRPVNKQLFCSFATKWGSLIGAKG